MAGSPDDNPSLLPTALNLYTQSKQLRDVLEGFANGLSGVVLRAEAGEPEGFYASVNEISTQMLSAAIALNGLADVVTRTGVVPAELRDVALPFYPDRSPQDTGNQ